MFRRRTLLTAALALPAAAVAAPAVASADPSVLPTTLNLPNGFQPEGIPDIHAHDQVCAAFEVQPASNRLRIASRRNERQAECHQHGADQNHFPPKTSVQDFLH